MSEEIEFTETAEEIAAFLQKDADGRVATGYARALGMIASLLRQPTSAEKRLEAIATVVEAVDIANENINGSWPHATPTQEG